ncbi:hypothetical protein PAMC26510_07785 [Caballeronia sordidicola]|uniref:Uncharacterized protein n=1 Tax=Caballeronia sordidicola TaxID=196367 RepID=A0A242N353_CABSO|nr:hypothetical protein PAMC26510_07785 [Caballeronia sordidicola]
MEDGPYFGNLPCRGGAGGACRKGQEAQSQRIKTSGRAASGGQARGVGSFIGFHWVAT